MRIHDAYTKTDRTAGAEGPAASGGRAKEPAGGAVAATGSSAATKVNVSARARELAANAGPSGARIDALRDQVRAGTFKVDAQSIAQRLVGDLEP